MTIIKEMESDDRCTRMVPSEPEQESPQFLVALAVNIIVFSAGATVAWSSPALARMRSPNATLPLTAEEASWVGSILAMGAFLGSIPAGSMVDFFGRKWVIMSISVPIMISWILVYCATTVNMICIARFIAGIAVGAVYATVPVYLVEIAEDSTRGSLGAMFQLMSSNGGLYVYIIAAIFPYTELPLLCGLLNIMFLIFFFKAPESPIYLIQKGRRSEATDALIYLRGKQHNIHKDLEEMEEEINSNIAEKGTFLKELSKRSNVLSLLVCLTLVFFQQLSGINAVFFFLEGVFQDAGTFEPAIPTIIAGVAQTIANFLSTVLIDFTGRRILLQISSTMMAVCMAILGYYFHEKTKGSDVTEFGAVPLIAVVAFIFMYSVGFGPISFLMSGEILPPEIKVTGLGIVSSFQWICAFAVTKAFQPINDALGPATSYWIFAAICVLGFFFSTFIIIETKGKSFLEIQEEMFGQKYERIKIIKSNGII
ncbi:unnamed protein product [Nezara viridula]|uniref:Major facilitator superfamily (MFS) profile domain-containing protein n=1 Tax=Nezara viridula TaxID=85310 RepID=A0A9P0MW52_NEZVI|nr:unnamed protein product [Nezara viridula]